MATVTNKQSIVLELQQLALDSNSNCSSLLRKALLAATKLGIQEFQTWLNAELHGYEKENVPNYRIVQATMYGENRPYPDLPITICDNKKADILLKVPCLNSIASLEDIYKSQGDIELPLSPNQIKTLQIAIKPYPPSMIRRTISKSFIAGIIDQVKTMVLQWALRLEQDGIMGYGLTFSDAEKQKAQIHIFNIGSVYGQVGDVSVDAFSQTVNVNVAKGDSESLFATLRNIGVPETSIADLKKSLAEDSVVRQTGSMGPSVSRWIGNILDKTTSVSWKIAINTVSSTISSAIQQYLGIK